MHLAAQEPTRNWKRSIQSMEIAFRMQTEAPDVFDIRKEKRRGARPLRRQAISAAAA